jgi:hypothetical protein
VRARDFLLFPLALAVAATGLIWGGKNSYVSLRNRSPIELTCEQYAAHPPDAQWLRLRDCTLDLDHMGVESTGRRDRPSVVYIPLRSPSGSAKLILTADEDPLRSLGDRLSQGSDGLDEWLRDAQRNGIPGLLELSVDRSARKKKEMQEIGLDAESSAILDYGAAPRPLALALGAFALGLGAVGYLAYRVRRSRRNRIELPRATLV